MTISIKHDYRALAAQLYSSPVLDRIKAKAAHALKECFITSAATVPAWPLDEQGDGPVVSCWLPPGTYRLGDLQSRFAPRYRDDPGIPHPEYQIIPSTVIEVVSGMVKTLLLLPEQDELRENAEAEDITADDLQQIVLDALGRDYCAFVVDSLKPEEITLEGPAILEAGRRAVLAEVIAVQERHHLRRSVRANSERYGQLLRQWQNFSGDIYNAHIGVGTPLAKELVYWLQTLTPNDAAVFLSLHNVSAKVAAGHGLPDAFIEAIGNASTPNVPLPYPSHYNTLRQLLESILSIPGLRRVTITTKDDKYVRVDLDPFNRVGGEENHLAYFVNLLLTGLLSNAGVMMRAFQFETMNVFVPSKGTFSQITVKHLYGVLLDRGVVLGMSAAQVTNAHTKHSTTGERVPREPSVRCLDWPGVESVSTSPKPGKSS